MGFKPQGMPNAFVRANTNNSQQRRRVIDRLVTIDSYDLGNRQINCTGEDGTKLMVTIRPETVARNIARATEQAATRPQAPKWEGYMIDSRMAESLPIGNKIVLERLEEVRTIQTNNVTSKIALSDRVLNIADPQPSKTFEGLFSISTYQSNVFHVQSWERKGISIDDAANIDRVAKELEEGAQAFLNKELRPHYGVQFRVLAPTNNEKNECTVLDTSPPFDWVPRKYDAAGQEVEPGHPLDGAKFRELLLDDRDGYLAYVNEKFTQETYPGRFVEVCAYINYRAGPRSRYMVIPERTFDPLYRLAHTQTKLAIDDESFAQGKNVAVLGVLQLSADQADMATRTFKARNIAVRLHASGPMGHVHAWVRSHDDRKCVPHEALRQVPVNRATPGEKTFTQAPSNYERAAPAEQSYAPRASAPAHNPQPPAAMPPAPSVASNPLDSQSAFDDWDDLDPFAEPTAPNANDARKKLEQARSGYQDDSAR